MQFKDRNYLVPIDAVMGSEEDVTFFSVDVSQVLDRMERARTRFNFVILDACRDNPLASRVSVKLKDGREFTLDGIEHDTLRKPGAYDEVRVHFAVNCASIGCPMLREEAYTAEKLDRQLEEQAVEMEAQQHEIKAAEERSRLVLSAIGEGLFGIDKDGNISFVNPAACTLQPLR